MNIQTRLSEGKRENIGPKLPLLQPYVLIVDPSSLCNLRCVWCPSSCDELIKASGRNQTVMDFELFKHIIDQLSDFEEPLRVLRMYKEGEPLVNPRFADMVDYAKKSGYIRRVDTTTNGILLSPKVNRKIIDAGIDQINISVNGVSTEQIYRNTGRKVDYKEYVNNIKDLYKNRGECTIYVKAIKDVFTEEEQNIFIDTFGEISNRVYLERLSPAWPRFDFSNSGYQYEEIGNYGQKVEKRQVCPYIFYIMVVNSDGTISTCVGDWKHKQIVGDVKKETVRNIWLGEKQKEYQLQHLYGKRHLFEMCADCKVITHGCYDNIDEWTVEIAEKIANR